ncbi:MAG: tetraacyldisaccharide 4'-kinase [Candidatus Aminicenantes bacterium]|nr:tetraacyldisaccharide 4'-kinase [Candidatus Aminicenantes bacterium]
MHLRANSTLHWLSRPALNLASLLFKTVSLVNLKIKALAPRHFPGLFIISVDNLSFGGTGKTPLVMAIGRVLAERALPFAIILRGYRSALENKGALVQAAHSLEEVGDEAWLLKKRFPGHDVIIGRDRMRSIAAVAARNNRFIILDDGLQTSQVRKDFSIMLVNPGHPYFFLRHFKFLARGENLVLHYQQRSGAGEALPSPWTYDFAIEGFLDGRDRPVNIGNAEIVAFAALGDNERFKRDMGHYRLRAFRGFPDHHAFSPADVHSLEKLRREKGAAWIVCTEKDFCKISHLLDAASPFIYARNRIELPGHVIEQIIQHAAEKNFL